MTRPLILAIDDDPGRYDGLRRMLAGRVDLVVACCVRCVGIAMPEASAILLDHDLNLPDGADDRILCTCGAEPEHRYSRPYLPQIIASGLPVIVTSRSAKENRAHLTRVLHGAGVRVDQHSAHEIMPERVWLGQLWLWGVL